MFKAQQQAISDQIYTFCAKHHLPTPGELTWKPIPFTGEWGISTSFFQLAAKEGKAIKETTGASINVAERAQELASAIATFLGDQAGYSRMEATKGYLNLYFSSAEYTKNLVDTVLEQGGDFGRGQSKGERVMIEYAQPNTHHSFHIGHFRNALLGEALARLVEFAGFNTIRATYPGDIGLGVITVLWIYQKFYQGQEREGIHERGQRREIPGQT